MAEDDLARELTRGDPWFDLWHYHADYRIQRKLKPAQRHQHLQKVFSIWNEVERFASQLKTPWQSWVLIDPDTPDNDSVYLHTPNPNQDNFPYKFEDVEWGIAPPVRLTEFVSNNDVDVGRSVFDGVLQYWIRRAN